MPDSMSFYGTVVGEVTLTTYTVRLDDGRNVEAFRSAKMAMFGIHVRTGARVELEQAHGGQAPWRILAHC